MLPAALQAGRHDFSGSSSFRLRPLERSPSAVLPRERGFAASSARAEGGGTDQGSFVIG